MDLVSLRKALAGEVARLSGMKRHVDLPDVCSLLGLPTPPPSESATKRERLSASFGAIAESDLPGVARRLLACFPPPASARNDIEDLLWADEPGPAISKRTRRDLARALDIEDLLDGADGFDKLLRRIWVIGEETGSLWGASDYSLGGEINQHVYRNRDWDTAHLFEQLGAFDCSSRRFLLFLEGLASPDVRPDEQSQRRFVLKVNQSLRACGLELRETGVADGYPTFGAAALGSGTPGRPKNLIFASSQKPDLRFRDAVSNDVEIVTNADQVLVYDRSIGADGLRWKDLQAWWAEAKEIQDPDRAKASLYRRLRASLPKASPPQQLLFRSFFEIYRQAVPDLPALLPEVWLHWDPKTVAERGAEALARFRMDFLLLLAGGVRVVVEVDGQHHYAHAGHADPARYAVMVAADRELKLAGYEVYRFGATELEGASGVEVVREFFAGLFKRHCVKP